MRGWRSASCGASSIARGRRSCSRAARPPRSSPPSQRRLPTAGPGRPPGAPCPSPRPRARRPQRRHRPPRPGAALPALRRDHDAGERARMIARLRRRLAAENGIALVMAVGILAFMSLTITGVIYFTSTNQRSSSYSRAEVASIDFAEAGINNALAVLFDIRNSSNLNNPNLLTPRTTPYSEGSVTWKGALVNVTGQPLYWLVTATGNVKNPTGPNTNPVKRTLTMRVPLQSPSLTTPAMEVWNWIYTHRTGFTCDMSILQSVHVVSPLYVRGNLCLRNGAKIARGPLIVGGSLDQQNPQTSVGTSAT